MRLRDLQEVVPGRGSNSLLSTGCSLLLSSFLVALPAWAAAGPPVSDDFNGTSLNTALWTAVSPAGGTISVSNGHVYLAVPGGSNHDPFVGGDNSVRILQTIANSDFDVAAKFDSGLSGTYQGEGILVQQDSATYLRLELTSNGKTSFSASLVSAGKQQTLFQVTPGNTNPSLWLQVQRSGNQWTISYSNNGTSYTTLGSFSQSLSVTAIGPYAWNYNSNPSQAPALTAAVDYFYNLGSGGGGGTNPPVISSISADPSSTAAIITWTTDELATSLVNYGLTSSYGQSSSNSTPVTSHNAQLSSLVCASNYHYQVASTNAKGQTSTSADQIFKTAACSAGNGPTSDNFDSSTLNTQLWTFVNPAGDGVLTLNGTGATLNLPGGTNHDPWTSGNKSVSLLQAIGNVNFQAQVRFQSDVEIGNQDEGILVQQDATHFLRFDVFNDGTSVRLFSAAIQGGSATVFGNTVINVTQAPIFLNLSRSGNNWVETWSTDGVNFHTGYSFSYGMTASSIGPYAGNSNGTLANSPAFTSIVDYFFNLASPVSNLDGPPPFQAITVDANPPSTLVEKTLADIQGTGHLDPVVGFESPSGGIYWYEYPASGTLTNPWLKHTIVSNGNAYEDMVPLDVNKDGAVDIIASYSPPGGGNLIVWFENPRGHGGNPATDVWNRHQIGTGSGENNFALADLDGDGKMD
ncbi:MAG: hypothetical protein JWP08_3047, partial [Bryobacterales bacterium]|nr:hypothetical protein [Bryobacterales bacterium]